MERHQWPWSISLLRYNFNSIDFVLYSAITAYTIILYNCFIWHNHKTNTLFSILLSTGKLVIVFYYQ